jgi:hypothetical protein
MAEHISIFVENRVGKLEAVTKLLSAGNVNLRGLSVAGGKDFGIIKILPDNPDKALALLKSGNFTVQKRKILVVEIEDRPGSLHECLMIFKENKINIEDCYGTVISKTGRAVMIMEVEDLPAAEKALAGKNVRILSDEEVHKV